MRARGEGLGDGVLDALEQVRVVRGVEKDNGLREDLGADDVAGPGFLLAFFKLWLLLNDLIASLGVDLLRLD